MRTIVQVGGINHRCEMCEREADWRLRNTRTDAIVAAACRTHKEEVRARTLARLACSQPPDPNEEHAFKADRKSPLYCRVCGSSETDHRL